MEVSGTGFFTANSGKTPRTKHYHITSHGENESTMMPLRFSKPLIENYLQTSYFFIHQHTSEETGVHCSL